MTERRTDKHPNAFSGTNQQALMVNAIKARPCELRHAINKSSSVIIISSFGFFPFLEETITTWLTIFAQCGKLAYVQPSCFADS